MTVMTLHTTRHAHQRQARRNLSDDDVRFVLQHGQRVYCAGAMHVFLGRRNLPREREIYQRHAHLEGTVLVLNVTGDELVLLTAYRNRSALKSIRARARYDRHCRSREYRKVAGLTSREAEAVLEAEA